MHPFRYKLTIEYLGTNLSGWQRQKGAPSVQQILEEAIYKFSNEIVTLFAAGRTDSGVHATGQVAHFDLTKYLGPDKVIQAINHFARPHTIGVTNCALVDNSFHARFSAVKRHYVYRIINRPYPVVIDLNRAWWIRQKLKSDAMREAAAYLIGTHDFSSFRAKLCQAKSPIKTISNITIEENGEEINFYLSAPSFLHHMVRNIVGSLVRVGLGSWQAEDIKIALEAKRRDAAGMTAPACGLYFLRVDY